MDHRLSPKDLPRAQFFAELAVNVPLLLLAAAVAILGVLFANPAAAASTTGVYSAQPVYLFGIPVDFILFSMTLLGVAVFHHKTLEVALTGLAAVTVYKLLFTGFRQGEGFTGLVLQLHHEWVILANLFLLLMGFAILSRHFEHSRIPDEMPAFLPNGWGGGLALLAIVFVLSSFLDNIAAALIGGTMARHVFKGKVHIGYLAAIVAASNAGGSGSVVGDTTTTMMWIDGISPLRVVEAYVAAVAGFLIYGIPAAIAQHRHSPIVKDAPRGLQIEWTYVGIVAAILVIAITANVVANLKFPAVLDVVPVIGLAVWIVILATAPLRQPDWKIMPETFKGTIFLLALVTNASFMPVEELPAEIADFPPSTREVNSVSEPTFRHHGFRCRCFGERSQVAQPSLGERANNSSLGPGLALSIIEPTSSGFWRCSTAIVFPPLIAGSRLETALPCRGSCKQDLAALPII